MNQISLAEYRQQIARIIEQERYTEAVAHGRHILEQYPKYVRAYWLLGKAMLEAGQNEHATDMFQRVLSTDPEHLLAWVGLSEIAKQRGELEAAVWYLERAFELATDNEGVAEELRHLHGEVEGHKPERLQLTQGALARLYLRGDLLSRATTELRKLLDENPDRVDLKVALAEALWRSGQRLRASEVCQEILDEQPYNLKANLILGEIWTNSGREEGEFYLERAEAVDPENEVAQELFGTASPLPPQEPQITPLEYEAAAEKERPAWMREVEELAPAEEIALTRPEEMVTTKIEIPEWLQEMAGEAPPEAPEPAPAEPVEEEFVEEDVPALAEEELEEPVAVEPVAPEEMADEEALEWLRELEEEEGEPYEAEEEAPAVEREEEIPAWLTELEIEPVGQEAVFEAEEPEEEPEAEEPEPAEIPDWLRDLAPAEAELSEMPPPDALAALLEEEIPVGEEPEDVQELPAWLESDDMPSGDDALAWLEELTRGKEEELLAQAEAESEARLAEIMGRPELAPEEAIEEPEEPTEELEFEEPTLEAEEMGAPEEVAAPEEFEFEGELPAWLKSEGMPSGDEALAWLEELTRGKEEELLAQAEAESEARLAEIMERPELAPEEAVEEPEEPTEEPTEEEAFGWTAFVEATTAEEVEAVKEAPTIEEPEEMVLPEEAEAAPVAEAEEPPFVAELEEIAPSEEAEAPPEAEEVEAAVPAVEVPEDITPAEEAEALPEEEAVPEGEELAPAEEAALAEALEPVPAEEEAVEPAVAEQAVPEIEAPRVDLEVPSVAKPEPEPAPAEAAEPEIVEEALEPEAITTEEEAVPAAIVEEVPVEDLGQFIARQRSYAEERPEDHEAWLELGRVLWQADKRDEAVETYDHLIRRSELLDEIIPDLEDYAEQWADPSVRQALGDAYMRADRLQDALNVYRQALASL